MAPFRGRFCDRFTRRRLLEVGSVGVAGLTLPGLLRAEAAEAAHAAVPERPRHGAVGRARSCILVFLDGGPSHLDMWDMKPNAPAEVRGSFRPLSTPVAGIQLCEHLPRLARLAPEFALVRSLHHSIVVAHGLAVYHVMTGDDKGPGFATARDYPGIGAVVGRLIPTRPTVPPYVCLPYRVQEGAGGPPQGGFYGGWMGERFDPLYVDRDPNDEHFRIPELSLPFGFTPARIEARRGLLRAVNHAAGSWQCDDSATALDSFQQRALEILTSPEARQAFDIAREPADVRERYGRNVYGQSVLLARRLIEAGTRMVTVCWAPNANATWDTHATNFPLMEGTLLPQLDAALSSLLVDLKDRGLLDETLVVCMGEFGRSPKINPAGGREHWPGCYSALLAGGGVRGGQVVGKSDELGAEPAERALTPQDLLATIYGLLGISTETEFLDPLNRPLRIISGSGAFISEIC